MDVHAAVVRLAPADADRYVVLRREMLIDTPHAFGSSPEDDRFRTTDQALASLADPHNAIFAVQASGQGSGLVAAAGVIRETRAKRRHIASIWGVYVAPMARGRGLGRAVVRAAVSHARTWEGVSAVQLCVSEGASPHQRSPARRLYDSLGFLEWGREPEALRVDGRGYAEIHMSLSL